MGVESSLAESCERGVICGAGRTLWDMDVAVASRVWDVGVTSRVISMYTVTLCYNSTDLLQARFEFMGQCGAVFHICVSRRLDGAEICR
jgi:hypothetical protein